ncbi:MAG: hypothetical protein LBD61_05640 [Endomicrobium sp.]|nr:hypothetical protein [Endomicrobium sp.]
MNSPKQDLSKKYPAAAEILRQLGGGRALVMAGATAIFDKDYLILKLRSNYLQIRLNALDLYDIRYCADTQKEPDKPIAQASGVFCENLIETCQRLTGLYFRLF